MSVVKTINILNSIKYRVPVTYWERGLPHTPPYNQQALVTKGGGVRKVWRRRVGDFFFGLGAAFGRDKPKDPALGPSDPALEPSDPANRPNRRLEDKKPKGSE